MNLSDKKSMPDNAMMALVGNPNSGKTLLFNALTGLRRKVANYAGVTVDRVEGTLELPCGKSVRLLDLPGLYSLTPMSDDERVARDVLKGTIRGVETPKLLVVVVDATNLQLHLRLVLELRELGYPMVIALNMIDLANRSHTKIDAGILQKRLGVWVVPVSALKGTGLEQLREKMQEALLQRNERELTWHDQSPEIIHKRVAEVDDILAACVKEPVGLRSVTSRIDAVLLHPVVGPVILVAVLALVFQAVFTWSKFPMDAINKLVELAGSFTQGLLPQGILSSLVVDGIIGGVGSVLVFLPQIVILFGFILILEDSGYLARAAFLMDRIMGTVGLSGKSVLPLMSGMACAIPGMISARTINNRSDRLVTILITPLMTCSARLPVYALLIAAFVPNRQVAGFLNLQGIVLLVLYLAGILATLFMALVMRKFVLKGEPSSLFLELPTYKWPALKSVLRGLYDRAAAFLKKAGTFILAISVIMWFLSTFPRAPEGSHVAPIDFSFAGRLGHLIEPLLAPLGFPWQVAVAMVPGFAAREVLVGALGTVYAVENSSKEAVAQGLTSIISTQWSLATALALLAWYVFSPQCLATFAVMQKETRSWKLTVASFVTYLAMAYVAAFAVNQAALRWGWSWN